MKILVLNSGSSSLKFQVLEMPKSKVLCSGLFERIAENSSIFHYENESIKEKIEIVIDSHKIALEILAKKLLDSTVGVINSPSEIVAVGHRVVHGGDKFTQKTIITPQVKFAIKKLFSLAPLHNPANYQGIEVAEQVFPSAKQIAVFDTAFHQTIPEKAYRYAIPKEIADTHKIRMYGFHGTSHKYVSNQAIQLLNTKNSKIISIHLGNGCSISAIKDGICIDHSLGFTPSNGLIMGTRSGDIDHSLIFYLQENGYSSEELQSLLNKKSGMFGLSGFSDLRDIISQAENGNNDCKLALDMNVYRIKKYIGSYSAILNGLDALVFTAGIGENSAYIRENVCQEMEFLGISLNQEKNSIFSKEHRFIESENSKVKVIVIPTNEELEIATQCFELIN